MPAKARFFLSDPDGIGRGSGMYYRRYRKGYYSKRYHKYIKWAKRDFERDKKIVAGLNPSKDFGMSHAGDRRMYIYPKGRFFKYLRKKHWKHL